LGGKVVAGRRILIIDDDPAVLACYGRLFRREGYDPFLETDGTAAENRLEEYQDVEVVILDYRMPGMNGLELLRRLRGRNFRAQIVLVSGHSSPEMLLAAKRLGIRWIFSKPVDTARLLSAVAESIGSPQAP
jgi:CheY-like chemotaxis protein